MNKNFMKKLSAILTAGMMTAVLSASGCTFAANSPVKDNQPAHTLGTSVVEASIPIPKDIVLFNSNGQSIYEPNMVYTYNITTADVRTAKITTVDHQNNAQILAVYTGPIAAVTSIGDSGDSNATMTTDATGNIKTGTITFGNFTGTGEEPLLSTNIIGASPINASYKARKQMIIGLDASKIYKDDPSDTEHREPGVYRYQIEEVTTQATYDESGVTAGTASNTIYLDVYTKYNTAEDGLLIYGYVLFRDTETADASITYNETADDGFKIEGFVTNDEGDEDENGYITDNFIGDYYTTYNVVIEKQVKGDLANHQHEFPFQIQLSNATITNQADILVKDNAAQAHITLADDGSWDSSTVVPGSTIDYNLKDNETITFYGIPAGTQVKVKETNDTDNVYTASAVCNSNRTDLVNNDGSKEADTIALSKNDTAELKEAFGIGSTNSDDRIVFTNTLSDVSVTGLVFDIAPFIFITAAGVVLLVVFLRSRQKKDNDTIF